MADRHDAAISHWAVLREIGRMMYSAGMTLTKFSIILLVVFGAFGLASLLAITLVGYIPTATSAWMGWMAQIPAWVWTGLDLLLNLFTLAFWVWLIYSVWTYAKQRVKERENDDN